MKATSRKKYIRALRTFAIYGMLGLLLWWALRTVPLNEIWDALKQLRFWQIGVLLLLNVLVLIAMTARWWAILRVEYPNIPFLKLVRYRLVVFGLSYFTPGPQVGGEPLQVIYLQRNHSVTFARATAAVIMDKLLEFLANFILLGIGLTAAVRVGLVSRGGTPGSRESDPAGGDFAVAARAPGVTLPGQVSCFGADARRHVPHKKTKMDAAHHRLRTHGRGIHTPSSARIAGCAGILVAILDGDGCRIFFDGRLSTGTIDSRTNPGRTDCCPIRLPDAPARRAWARWKPARCT